MQVDSDSGISHRQLDSDLDFSVAWVVLTIVDLVFDFLCQLVDVYWARIGCEKGLHELYVVVVEIGVRKGGWLDAHVEPPVLAVGHTRIESNFQR